MAFNPFNWFRKHQKVIFAVMTIVIMFLFVGSFGPGDLVATATRLVGGGRASGPVVATLYGKKVREGDLTRLASNRKLASNFLFATAWDHHAKVCADLLKNQLQSTAPDNPLSGLREIVQSAQQRTGFGLVMMATRMSRERLRIQIEEELNQLEAIASRDKVRDDAERFDMVRNVATILGFQFWITGPTQIQEAGRYAQTMMMGGRNRAFPTSFYFGGSEQTEDLLDFVLWRHQADKLGIQLVDKDVAREVNAEAAGAEVIDPQVGFDANRAVTAFMSSQPGVAQATSKDLLEGLREEFRVVMTQAALLGSEPGARAYRLMLGAASSPALATPDEFLNYFREVRTTPRVKFLTVPAAKFLDQVKDQPGDTELRTRFDRYKNQEPTPTSREPGFKEPRRVQVEYVYASPNDPYYRDLGKGRLFAWAAGLVGSVNPFEAAALALADPLREEYDREVRSGDSDWFYNPRDTVSMYEERLKKLHYTSVMQPRAIAALVAGQATGSTLGALSGLYSVASFEEVKASVKFNLTQLLASAEPAGLFANATLIAAALPEPASFKLMEPQILASVQERAAEEELRKNLKKVSDELVKLKGRAKEAKELVTKAAKDYQLKYLAMPDAMTRDAIVSALKKGQDLGLAPLREALMKVARQDRIEQFADDLFVRNGTYDPMQFPTREPRREEYVFWRSQDLQSRSREYGQVRSEVEAAWRLEKARQLARREAERLEDEINKAKFANATDAARFLNEQKLGEVFELENVAQLVPPREVLAARRTEYSPYQIPESSQSLFEFPPADLAKQLLTLKRPGEATVIADLPGKNYYVAVLMERSEPTMADFKSIYARTPKEDTLYSLFVTQRRADYRKSVLEQLRREAAGPDGVDKDGRFKIPDAARRDQMARDEE